MGGLPPSPDTIVAIATAPGRGGIGIVRLSGPGAVAIGKRICGIEFSPRHAHYAEFSDDHGELIDSGIVLFFPAPGSFTGEDVIELQGHGGPVVLDMLLRLCCAGSSVEPAPTSASFGLPNSCMPAPMPWSTCA